MENNNNVYIIKSKPSMTAYIKVCDTRNNRVIYIREKLWEEKRKLYYYDRINNNRYGIVIMDNGNVRYIPENLLPTINLC